MRNSIGLLFGLLTAAGIVLTTPRTAQAQPWGFTAVTMTSATAGGGWNFGSGRITAGLWGDVCHPNDLTLGKPDFEAAAGIAVQLGRGWFVSPNVGAGVTVTSSTDWSGRALVVLSRATPVAFRLHWYSILGVTTSAWLTKVSIGPSIQLGNGGLRIFPNLGIAINSPGSGHDLGVSLVPGVALFF